MFLPIGIKHPLNVTVQCPHDANPREHRWPAQLNNEQQAFHRGLPFGGVVLRFRKLGDISAGVLQGDKLATARQRDWIVKLTLPSVIWH